MSLESRNSNNTFILGLGFQKCGTSWLYSYLQQSTKFDGGDLKEYHIWDAIDIPLLGYNRVKKPGILRSMYDKSNTLRYRMESNSSTYFDYFEGLYSDTVSITGDITPSYSGLQKSRLENIISEFNERGIRCKSVLLMRDPVDRIKSAVRYNLDRGNYDEGIKFGENNFIHALEQYYMTDHCKIRTRYDKTIETIREVFDEEDVYLGIYENMFDSDQIDKISNYVGVSSEYSFASVRVNKTKSPTVSSENIESDIRDYYSEVYEYCNEKIPETKILWR